MLRRVCAVWDEVVGFKLLLGVPADLAADKDQRATGGDAVGVAFGGEPAFGLEEFSHCFIHFKSLNLIVIFINLYLTKALINDLVFIIAAA